MKLARIPLPPLLRRADVLIALAVLATMLGVTAWISNWGRVERFLMDELTVRTASGELGQPIQVIAINDDALQAIGKQWPWPRTLHAELVNRVASGGAAVIALDLIFAEPAREPAEDVALAQAIRKAGNVVLAADFIETDSARTRIWRRVDPLPALQDAGALSGLATVTYDPDKIVRQIPGEPDAFWRQVVKLVQVRAPSLAIPPLPPEGALIRYPGPDTIFDPIPYHMVLEASESELKQAFEGRIVFVGREVRSAPELGRAQSDLFATPFPGDYAGMKLHATLVENAMAGSWLRPLRWIESALLQALAAVVAFFAFRHWRPLVGLAVLGVLLAGLAGAAWYAFTAQRVWIAAGAPAAVLVLAYLAYGLQAYVVERRRKGEIQRAFSRYLAPELVDRIAADPSKLSLGGESREITVMFTDLAGFTKLTEKTPPEIVTKVLIAHFNAMTDVIQAKRGTVVQFIGDAIMAFWNAPLDDPEHALHAVEAAIAMQEAMEKLRVELRAQGLPELHMRIGVNTCQAVVGNMGSSTRFYYTAMGDGINLGSRLEGANKHYGTRILVSGETVAGLAGRIPMRRVDRIKVAGKSQAVDVFTPVGDPALADATQSAFDAYLRRDWELAARLYAEMRERQPQDGVAERLIERIESWKREPELASEDGSTALDKL